MDIFERIRKIRKERKLTQDDVAQWYGVSAASYGRKERGAEGGFGPAELQRFVAETHIDARYLFGQIDSFEKADLTREENVSVESDIKEIKSLLKTKIPDAVIQDPDFEALGKKEIRELVRLLKPWSSDKVRQIIGYAEAKADQWAITKAERIMQPKAPIEKTPLETTPIGGLGANPGNQEGGMEPQTEIERSRGHPPQ